MEDIRPLMSQIGGYLHVSGVQISARAPNINAISAPLRKLVVFEIIVVERGQYEVQKITYHKNYRRPLQDIAKLDYIEELAHDTPFPPLPREVQKRYDAWRVTEKLKLYPSLLREIQTYVKLGQWAGDEEDIPVFEGRVIKASHGYVVTVPDVVGDKLHGKKVKIAIG